MTLTIRKAVFDDIETMANLFQNTVGFINCKDYSPEQINAWQHKATRKRWLELWNSGLTFIVAENSTDGLIGFASFNTQGYIHSLFVHYLFQRRGIASALLKEIGRTLQKAKLSSDVSITAKPFFERNGFRIQEEIKVNINGIELLNYKMIKEW